MTQYLDEEGERKWAYGIIKQMFTHKLYPGHTRRIIVRCKWYTEIQELSPRPAEITAIRPTDDFDDDRYEFLDARVKPKIWFLQIIHKTGEVFWF